MTDHERKDVLYCVGCYQIPAQTVKCYILHFALLKQLYLAPQLRCKVAYDSHYNDVHNERNEIPHIADRKSEVGRDEQK